MDEKTKDCLVRLMLASAPFSDDGSAAGAEVTAALEDCVELLGELGVTKRPMTLQEWLIDNAT